ncbi:cytochrome c oxidase subunit 3 [Luminiphilus sp. nBUS_16]|uniref:cytochrome c oxidase subunit 3 n=1 Tax=Luminiphilus sp. nBUS_16 TaxID=3395315 RepID=UPI003EC12AA6
MSTLFTEHPWIASTEPVSPALSAVQISVNSRRSALKVLLSVVTVFFLLMIVACGGRMLYQDWRPAPQINLLWANTGLLMLSSLCLQAALLLSRAAKSLWVRVALVGAGVLTLLFLVGQLAAWLQLTEMVLGDFSNPSVGFFFMITGVHGLHMVGGMIALTRAIKRSFEQADVRILEDSLSNCALYWHYLLGVWLVVFGLLFIGDNFEVLLRICGFI